jgi:hypothetical protein
MIILCFSPLLFSQANPAIAGGKFLLGGDLTGSMELGVDATDVGGSVFSEFNTFTLGVSLESGYFIFTGVEIGPAIYFSYSDKTRADDSSIYTRSLSAHLGLQVGFFISITPVFCLLVKISGYYVFTSDDLFGISQIWNGIKGVPELGVNIFLNTSIALEISIFGSMNWNVLNGSSPPQNHWLTTGGLNLGINTFF